MAPKENGNGLVVNEPTTSSRNERTLDMAERLRTVAAFFGATLEIADIQPIFEANLDTDPEGFTTVNRIISPIIAHQHMMDPEGLETAIRSLEAHLTREHEIDPENVAMAFQVVIGHLRGEDE